MQRYYVHCDKEWGDHPLQTVWFVKNSNYIKELRTLLQIYYCNIFHTTKITLFFHIYN